MPQALSLLPVSVPESKAVRHIWILGDSNGEKQNGWVDQLKSLLPQADICNNSRSGRTIGFDNNGDPELNALHTLRQDLDAAGRHFRKSGCDAIVVCLGTNDTKAVFADRQHEVADNFTRLLETINHSAWVRRFRPRCIFVTPPPMNDTQAGPKYTGGNERLGQLIPELSAIARKYGWEVIDIYHPFQTFFKEYAPDGVHMEADGQRIVAQKIFDPLTKEALEEAGS